MSFLTSPWWLGTMGLLLLGLIGFMVYRKIHPPEDD